MKALILVSVVRALFCCRCKTNSTANNVSGTYVLQTKGEYAIDYDTLVISSDHSSRNTYTVQNKSGFQKIRNGITLPKEFKKTS